MSLLTISMPDFTGCTLHAPRVHRMFDSAQPNQHSGLSEEDRRLASLAQSIYRSGEKRDATHRDRNQAKKMRHDRIVSFLSKIARESAVDTHVLALELGLHYTTTVNDLILLRAKNMVSFNNPMRSGIGRLYWGLENDNK